MSNAVMPSRDQMLRAAFFVPCTSKEALKRWIKTYLRLDLPDKIVCGDDTRTDPSNSSPMDLIWEIYEKMIDGKDPNFQRILAYAARDSYKTVACSVLESLAMFHARRSVGHLAAIEAQAQKCAEYIGNYLKLPILRDFVSSNNKRTLEVTWYETTDRKQFFTPAEYKQHDNDDMPWLTKLNRKTYYVQILVATMTGTNSLHVPFLVLDELDLAPPKPYKEAMMIPSMGEEGQLPIVFMTSSRKFSIGLVQKEIDSAKETGLHIRHWNYIDVSAKCPTDRHEPHKPRLPLYYSENTLQTIRKDDYELLDDKAKEDWHLGEGYAGCITNCSLFAVCRGRLATKQTSTSNLLKNLHLVTQQFKTLAKDVDIAKAQLMCWKPSSIGLIYPHLNRPTHMKSAQQMAEMISGDQWPETFGKSDLINLLRSVGATFVCGMDFGYTHNFAVVVGAIVGVTLYIIHAFSVSGFELGEKLKLCDTQLKPYHAVIYADPAYPSDIKSFRKAGYIMPSFTKEVQLGINATRSKIMPTLGARPEIFFLKDEPGIELLFTRLSRYHWKMDAAELPTDEPDDHEDDECDALRYLCQNQFGKLLGRTPPPPKMMQDTIQHNPNAQWMKETINGLVGPGSSESVTVRKGKFFFGT